MHPEGAIYEVKIPLFTTSDFWVALCLTPAKGVKEGIFIRDPTAMQAREPDVNVDCSLEAKKSVGISQPLNVQAAPRSKTEAVVSWE